ncbi:MAG: T4 RnlA family RNA ligase [bacterium]
MKEIKSISWGVINDYIKEGLLIKNKHPIYDIWILNYSQTCQFDKKWDDVTLLSRGLVVDGDGNIVARCFPKFFNYEELINDPKLGEIPYGESFEVYEKVDGSLIIMFYYNNEWIFASRGSFISEQAMKAKEIFNEKYNFLISGFEKTKTYLFEVLYKENRIVVNYGDDERLVLLGIIHTDTGQETSLKDLAELDFNYYGKSFIVKQYHGICDISEIREKLENDSDEGVVVRFSSGFRMKVKWKEYCRLHKIVTNISSKDIWEYLRTGKSIAPLLEKVPDEFFEWVQTIISNLNEEYNYIELQSLKIFWKIYVCDANTMRKDFALEAKESKYSGILFKMYEGKEYSDLIWKMIKPEYKQPFKSEK